MQQHRIRRKRKPNDGKFIRRPNHDQGVQTRPMSEDEWQNRRRRDNP